MAKKKITVKNLLELIDPLQPIKINYYAYGMLYSDSLDSGTTADDLLNNLRKDCLDAEVHEMHAGSRDDSYYIFVKAIII